MEPMLTLRHKSHPVKRKQTLVHLYEGYGRSSRTLIITGRIVSQVESSRGSNRLRSNRPEGRIVLHLQGIVIACHCVWRSEAIERKCLPSSSWLHQKYHFVLWNNRLQV